MTAVPPSGPGSDPLVSVVTPVYNTGEYLEQAIVSVLAQSYTNFEYLICDNHSTDATSGIAEKYARLDPRIRVIRPPQFLPQAENFNFALQHISPESRYTKMILADDRMFPRCLTEMVALADANPSVAVVSAYRLVETEGACFGLPVETPVISGRVACRLHLLNSVFLFGTPSTVMYRSDVVRSRAPEFYPTDRFYFDTDAVFQILADTDFGFVHQIATFSRYQPGSITDSVSRYYSRDIDRILCLHAYAKTYLTTEEETRAMARAWRVYYEQLGRQWLTDRFRGGKSHDFWDFHQKRLSGAGLKLSPFRLAIGACGAVVRAVGSPFELVQGMVRNRRHTENPWRA